MNKRRIAGLMALTIPLLASHAASAQSAETISVRQQRTFSYPSPISRIAIEKEGIVSVAAPSAKSLRITGIGPGEVTVNVYGTNGRLIAQTPVSVVAVAGPSLRRSPRIRRRPG